MTSGWVHDRVNSPSFTAAAAAFLAAISASTLARYSFGWVNASVRFATVGVPFRVTRRARQMRVIPVSSPVLDGRAGWGRGRWSRARLPGGRQPAGPPAGSVEDEAAGRFEHPHELGGAHTKPLDILFTLPRPIMRSLGTLCPTAESIVAGIAASTITGQMPLTVGVMLAGTLGARWAHDRDDHRLRATVHG